MRRLVVLALVTLTAVGVTACQPAVTTPAGYKSLLTGLVDKGSEVAYHRGQPYSPVDLSNVKPDAGAFGGVVVNQTWSQLEPSQGTFDFSTLDKSFAAVTAYNAQLPSAPLGVRLRVFAAYAAPEWTKTLDGAPITVPAHLPSNTGGTLGQWWKPAYRTAWAGLQQALAARYDASPVLNEVAVSSCATLTAEPFVMAPGTLAAATVDGWTTAAQQACLDGAFTDYASWTHTAIYYPVNPLPGDPSITTEVMQHCANSTTSGGPWCVLANNALSPTSGTTDRSAPVYAEMIALWGANSNGTPIALQMNGPNNSTYCAGIALAVDHHAQSVELWPAIPGLSGYTGVPLATLETWNSALKTGVAPTC